MNTDHAPSDTKVQVTFLTSKSIIKFIKEKSEEHSTSIAVEVRKVTIAGLKALYGVTIKNNQIIND